VQAEAVATTTATTSTEPTTTATTTDKTANGKREHSARKHKAKKQPPIGKIPTVQPRLTAGHYVFPVYGDSAYADTFGAPRADVAWHHGDDIFAPLGAPVLAVADGTVFSVGWNQIGGWRLWLRDLAGNEFYYAHLSAYSPYALNNVQVRAGTVLGFVGDTGDAEGRRTTSTSRSTQSDCSASATTAQWTRRRTWMPGSGCRTSASAPPAPGCPDSCGLQAAVLPSPARSSCRSPTSRARADSIRLVATGALAGVARRPCARRRLESAGERESGRSRPRLSPDCSSRSRPGSRM